MNTIQKEIRVDAIKESLKEMDIEKCFTQFYDSVSELCKKENVAEQVSKEAARVYYIAGATHICTLLNKIRKDAENARQKGGSK